MEKESTFQMNVEGLSAASIIAMADVQTYHAPADGIVREGKGIFNDGVPLIETEGSE